LDRLAASRTARDLDFTDGFYQTPLRLKRTGNASRFLVKTVTSHSGSVADQFNVAPPAVEFDCRARSTEPDDEALNTGCR
jgi:hypothetical protein